MTYPRILLLEDVAFDREMIRSTLVDGGIGGQFYCVDNRDAFLSVLRNTSIDLILADYSLPDFDGLSALEIVRAQYPDIPFILVTGLLGEELAVETLKQGATDYVLKQRLDRLPLSVNRALRERHERIARMRAESALQASEDRFQTSIETMLDCFGLFSALRDESGQIIDFCVEYVNRAAIQHLALAGGVRPGQRFCQSFPLAVHMGLFEACCQVVETGEPLLRESLFYRNPDKQEDLLIALDVRAARVRQGVVITWRDITARKQYEQEREELLAREQAAREQAEKVNRVKDEFLATLSHELRTPLNALQGWLQILQRRNISNQTATQAFQTIQRNLDALKRLIEDVLDVSRIVRGELRLQVAPLEVAPVVLSAIEVVLPAVQAKNLLLITNLPPESGHVMGDRDRLQQIIWNLLSNAVKFTPAGGRIDVRLESIDTYLRVQVQDTGRGIEPAFIPHIFERFYQGDSSPTRSYTGLGLGLAIVRHLVELHGGNIQVESSGPGQGATFSVYLPKLPSEPTPPLPGDSTPVEGPLLSAGFPTLEEVRVLLVEADTSARELYTMALAEAGAIVTAVTSVQEALSLLETFHPQVLISDFSASDSSCHELIRRVRRQPGPGKTVLPAIALTPAAQPDAPLQALESGYQMHLQKPIDVTQLAAAVAHLTEAKSACAPTDIAHR